MTQYFLVLNGPLCSGKTSTADYMINSEPTLMRISRDKIKRFISDYGPENNYKAFLDELLLSITGQALKAGLSVIMEGSPNLDTSDEFKKIAERNNVKYVEINLEASAELLKERFYKRLKLAEEQGFKMFCKTEERMNELNEKYYSIKNTEAPTITTDTMSTQEVVQEIKKII